MALEKCTTCGKVQDPYEGKEFSVLSGARLSQRAETTQSDVKCEDCGNTNFEMITIL